MKKLLSILASVGLTTTAAISVVACSTPQDENKIKDQVEPKTLEKSFWIGLETTPEGDVLSKEDQTKVEKRVIAALKAVNQNVVIEEDTFTVLGLTEMKTDSLEVKVEVKETNSTVDQPGLKAKNLDLEVKFTLPQDKNEVSNKINEIASQTLTLEIPGKEIKSEDIQKQILTELKEFELGLEFKQTKWEPIIVDEKDGNLEIKNGTLGLNISFSGDDLNKQFEFSFMSEGYTQFEQVNQVLTKIKENPTINLSNLEIDLGDSGKGTLQDILSALGRQIFAFIPDKIPANFIEGDEGDPAWNQWQETLKTIQLLLKQLAGIDIDEKMSLSFDLEFGTFKGKINLEITISKLLTAILPDLVHFRHFLIEQVKLESDNLLLLLIQYLFEKPRDIENDGFANLNQTIPNVNKPKEFITFNTNLERFVHDLLHGWQTADGIMWKEDQNNNLDPVSIQGEFFELFHVDFKYQRKDKTNDIAVFELLPMKNLKAVITQLFNYDLNQSLHLELELPFGQEDENGEIKYPTIPIDIDLGSLIKSNLKNILKIHPDLKDQLEIDNLTFDWKKGTLQTKILNSKNEWIIPQEFGDLLTAKDLRVDFIVDTLNVKYSDLVVTLKDIHLTFNLDLKASWLFFPTLI